MTISSVRTHDAPAINWRLNPVACDCCNKPLPRAGVFWSKTHRELPFVALPYVACSDCSNGESFDAIAAIVRRAERHSPTWAAAVQTMLMQPVPGGAS